MLALQHSRQQHPFGFADSMDPSLHDPYLAPEISPYLPHDTGVGFAPLPFSWQEGASFPSEPPSHNADLVMFNARRNIFFDPSAPRPQLRSERSNASDSSITTDTSSMVVTPQPTHAQLVSSQPSWSMAHSRFGPEPTIMSNDPYDQAFAPSDLDADVAFNVAGKKADDFVDPSLIQPSGNGYLDGGLAFSAANTYHQSVFDSTSTAVSPDPSHAEQLMHDGAAHLHPDMSTHVFHNSYQHSPYLHRRTSIASINSVPSRQSPMSGSADFEAESQDKGRCPHSDCGRVFKDLKAHMLTHQSERPEKCPILNCEYNQKGFARKYDKNRHTLTHYKGNMVCGFCPGSGSSVEKSFNRADVFKRHLTSVHAVEQNPPNSRKRCHGGSIKKPTTYCHDATGKCSTCSATFSNAQDFYEHLDDCVLRVVQQEEPSEAINHHHLADIAADDAVKATIERNLPPAIRQVHTLPRDNEHVENNKHDEGDDDDDSGHDSGNYDMDEASDEDGEGARRHARYGRGTIGSGHPAPASQIATRGGVCKPSHHTSKTFPLPGVGSGPLAGRRRRRRKDYPAAWGKAMDQMNMKKRVVYVNDGERRLWKDDMMISSEFEVRVNLADGKSYVTDLDVATLDLTNGLDGAGGETKGRWVQDQGRHVVNLDNLIA